MADISTRATDRDADALGSDELRAAKRRRASRMPTMPAIAADSADAGEYAADAGQPTQTANKLTKGQKAILIRTIAMLHYVDAVRAELAEEYPGFPEISDNLIRYYRRQIDADVLEEAKAARDVAIRSGLANKAVRVRYLIRMVEQWRRVPLVESAIYLDERGQQQTAYKTREGASREMRELLKQIAQELGEFQPSGQGPAGADRGTFGENADDEDIDEDLRTDLQEMINSMAERDMATRAALLEAIRPERT